MTGNRVDPASPLYNRAHEALTAALNGNQGFVLRNCWSLTRSELQQLADAAQAVADTAQQVRGSVWPGHPTVDPGDGRTECGRCGKWVWAVTHSCKRIPVTEAAMRRHQERAGEKP